MTETGAVARRTPGGRQARGRRVLGGGVAAIAGQAANGEEAVWLAASQQPDVLLMDIRMPVLDGHRGDQAHCQQA